MKSIPRHVIKKINPLNQNKVNLREVPYRSEYLSPEKLIEYAKRLAHTQEILPANPKKFASLLSRVKFNEKVLLDIHEDFLEVLKTDNTVLPSSAEWLLDNYYIITEQFRLTQNDLSRQFYSQLPRIKSGPLQDYPRIYNIALEFLRHRDSEVDIALLEQFVSSYQTIYPLSTAELWATPIMMRIVLIENLRRVMEQALHVQMQRQKADEWLQKIIGTSKKDQEQLINLIASLFQNKTKLEPTFLVRLLRGLKDQDPSVAPVIRFIELYMAQEDINLSETIKTGNQEQAINRITTGNIITSMKLLSSLDWKDFFEKTSLVEKILRSDPAGVYEKMDFSSRDHYRHQIEKLSQASRFNEQETARRVVKLASEAHEDNIRERHVGYYLIGQGQESLKKELRYTPARYKKILEKITQNPTPYYVGTIATSTLAAAAISQYVGLPGAVELQTRLLTTLAIVLPVSVPITGIVNWLVNRLYPASPPVKLEIKGAIDDESKTIIIVPCLVESKEKAIHLVESLENKFLANREKNVYFALLSDFLDAPKKEMPQDDEIVNALSDSVKTLNQKYENFGENLFYVLHRERMWNDKEGVWMGWERKRGKIEEFNQLVRGNANTSYKWIMGDTTRFPHIKYAITLDADTQLPLNIAKKLIGAISHPLNKPVVDPVRKIVTEGYGIIQPRVDISAPSASRSLFSNIFTEDTGLDPYSAAVSNVYQDLFGSAIFIGKAIYDIDVMNEVLGGRFPENKLLSHDLIEGAHLRVALASDIELLEEFPLAYDGFSRRQHRWIRGDWQIANWLLPFVRNGQGKLEKNPLPLRERWKIADNLRRSLIAPSVFLSLLVAWIFLPSPVWFWTTVILLSWMFPLLHIGVSHVLEHPTGESTEGYIGAVIQELTRLCSRALIQLTLLPYEAINNIDAILKVTIRSLVTHKKLLEWTAYATEESKPKKRVDGYLQMFKTQMVAIGLIAVAVIVKRQALPISNAVFLMYWTIAPWIAYRISTPEQRERIDLDNDAKKSLRKTARRIWRFYQELANVKTQYLPPDNIQIEPHRTITMRTSPTNIGFLLLAIVSAYDFGFLTSAQMIKRLGKTMNTVSKLKKYRGHLFNWYDIETLLPLHPEYISTVDSGNFVAALLTVKEACRAVKDNPDISDRIIQSASDIVEIALETNEKNTDSKSKEKVHNLLEEIKKELLQQRETHRFIKLQEKIGKLQKIETEDRDVAYWIQKVANQWKRIIYSEKHKTISRLTRLHTDKILKDIETLVRETDFSFLLDEPRNVFVTGLNVTTNSLDESYYDLLASEARLASIIATSMKQVPDTHWFKLGRPVTRINGNIALLSWGGTMFEYLMPNVLTKEYDNTLISQTNEMIIEKQMEYASRRNVPWGISESGFYAFDYQYNYQYRLFGVPDLRLKMELTENIVIAPYATFLALPYHPEKAWQNLKHIQEMGGTGEYGYVESLDFTKERLPKGQKVGIVNSYMAHHQGMSMVALDNYFHNNIMQERFHNDEHIKGIELLLQEKIPRRAPAIQVVSDKKLSAKPITQDVGVSLRVFTTPDTAIPKAEILSNGEFTTVISNSGSGYSAYKDIDITRWRRDMTLDNMGQFIILKEKDTDTIWSTSYHPIFKKPTTFKANFQPDLVEFLRTDGTWETKLQILVSPELPIEIREVTVTNTDTYTKELDVTTYQEMVLSDRGSDTMHPAYNKLFVETQYISQYNALLGKRRARKEGQQSAWAFQMLYIENEESEATEYETDREKFLGRGNALLQASAWKKPLSKTTGAPLDPIFSLRRTIKVKPLESKTITAITGITATKEEALELLEKFNNRREIDRTIDLAQIHGQIELRHLNVATQDATLFQRLGSLVMYPDPFLQANLATKKQNTKSQSGLFPYGISGDYPIMLVKISLKEGLSVIRQMLAAHEYLRMKNVKVDLVIVSEESVTYANPLFNQVQSVIETSLSHPWMDKPGGIYLRAGYLISEEDKTLLQSTAQIIIDADWGSLSDHLDLSGRNIVSHRNSSKIVQDMNKVYGKKDIKEKKYATKDLAFFNGIGGFDTKAKEYQIIVDAKNIAPAPWSNIISNGKFGTTISDTGLESTWMGNSQSNRLTPWSNDPLGQSTGEAIYVKNQDTGTVWSTTARPFPNPSQYKVRHGLGYSVIENEFQNITQEMTVFVPINDNIKLTSIKLKNIAKEEQNILLTYYVEWVLGSTREKTQQHILTEWDQKESVLLARNTFEEGRSNHVAYLTTNLSAVQYTADRVEFLGRNGPGFCPGILTEKQTKLSGKVGTNMDPCGVVSGSVKLGPGEEREIWFLLGEEENKEKMYEVMKKYKNETERENAFSEVKKFWQNITSQIIVKTPSEETNLLLNSWLLYQVLSCRVWARSAFYQSGGAFGFRDQLQDAMALIYSDPEKTKAQILNAAAHQFVEGDCLHWWHEGTNEGVRTKISDDFLWLPFVVETYVKITGDESILEEKVPFVSMPLLTENDAEYFGRAQITQETASIYDHCVKALEHAARFGEHGLPLMGTGDWNDGMNSIGNEGRGESIWLGWFIVTVYKNFVKIAKKKKDKKLADWLENTKEDVLKNLDLNGWNGEWYARAYADDGTVIGSKERRECQIDLMPQTWAVISESGDQNKNRIALQSAEDRLVKEKEKMILLLNPPFNNEAPFPGYIQGYIPGIRENGGQYTHGAVWASIAESIMGNGDRSFELFSYLNPISHTKNEKENKIYKLEPYVMAGDVYSHPQHMGRGGWSWYTGSAGWMYKTGIEYILGLKVEGDTLTIDPCIPKEWPGFEMEYKWKKTIYSIEVVNPNHSSKGVKEVTVDGVKKEKNSIKLTDDKKSHTIKIKMV